MPPEAILLEFAAKERDLITAFSEFRSKVRSIIAQEARQRRIAGSFAIEILGKRLLSGPVTFADSWSRCKLGLEDPESASDSDVVAAQRSTNEETGDDRESEQRQAAASNVIGSWMRAFADALSAEIQSIDDAVANLRIDLTGGTASFQRPSEDARFHRLCILIDCLLRDENDWNSNERLVVFTEYKTTLDYLLNRLRERFPNQESRVLSLFGGMEDSQREQVKERFNNPRDDVRILVATDAASEGLNLQSTARYLLHFDCPWNPSRLEQRNGRLDRHGQPRDVQIFHFASDEHADLKFIGYLIRKVDQIREDLGATGELFDEATHRCLIEGVGIDTVQRELDLQIDEARSAATVDADSRLIPTEEHGVADRLSALAAELDLDQTSEHATLETAMAIQAGRPQLTSLDDSQRCQIIQPSLSGWNDTIDETVRRAGVNGGLGPLPSLAFSADPFIEHIGGRPIFRPRNDTQMVHLGHPLMSKAVSVLTRRRFGVWTRGSDVNKSWSRKAITGESIRPRHLWQGLHGATLPIFIDDQKRLGVGRGQRIISHTLQWLRQGSEQLALVTNGYQWRLLFAGLDYEAFCEWDIDLWLSEGEASPEFNGFRGLFQPRLWTPPENGAPTPLLAATCHRPLDAFDDRRCRSSIVLELFSTIMDLDTSPLTEVFVIGTLVGVLKPPPAADVVDQDGAKVGLSALHIGNQLPQLFAAGHVETALAGVGVGSHDFIAPAGSVFANRIFLILR